MGMGTTTGCALCGMLMPAGWLLQAKCCLLISCWNGRPPYFQGTTFVLSVHFLRSSSPSSALTTPLYISLPCPFTLLVHARALPPPAYFSAPPPKSDSMSCGVARTRAHSRLLALAFGPRAVSSSVCRHPAAYHQYSRHSPLVSALAAVVRSGDFTTRADSGSMTLPRLRMAKGTWSQQWSGSRRCHTLR